MPDTDDREAARAWLWCQRKRAPHNADIWHMRHHAERLLPHIWQQVQGGNRRLSPMLQVGPATGGSSDGDSLMMWSAADALVLKWVALTVSPGLRTDPGCLHLLGGAQGAVRQVAEQLATGHWQYVYRTDIRGYYRHIRKDMAWRVWQENTQDPACLNLIQQYLHYSTETGGVIHAPATGIPRSAGPVVRALYG